MDRDGYGGGSNLRTPTREKSGISVHPKSVDHLRASLSDPRILRRWVGATILCGFFFLLWCNRHTWFFGDDFAFVFDRYLAAKDGRWVDALLPPHNEHWVTLPAFLHIVLQTFFGIDQHLIFIIPVVSAHCLAVWAASRVVFRATADGPATLAAALALTFMAAGNENLLWGFQVGFIGAPVLVILATLLCHRDNSTPRMGVASLLCCLAVMTQGTALSAMVIPTLVLLFQRRIRDLVIIVGPAAALFIGWYLKWGSDSVHSSPTNEQRLQWPQYVWKGIQASLDGFVNVQGAGAIVLALALVGLCRSRLGWSHLQLPIAMFAAAPCFFAISAWGRLQFGIDQAGASRYQNIGILFMSPLLIIGVYELVSLPRRRTASLLIVGAWIATAGISGLAAASTSAYPTDPRFRQTIEAAALLAADTSVVGGRRPSPQFNPNVTIEGIRRLIADGSFTPRPNPPEEALMEASLWTTLDILPSDDIASGSPHKIVGLAGGAFQDLSENCGLIESTGGLRIVVDTVSNQPLTISGVTGGQMLASYESRATGVYSPQIPQQLIPSTNYLISGWLESTKLVLDFPYAETVSICGARLP